MKDLIKKSGITQVTIHDLAMGSREFLTDKIVELQEDFQEAINALIEEVEFQYSNIGQEDCEDDPIFMQMIYIIEKATDISWAELKDSYFNETR